MNYYAKEQTKHGFKLVKADKSPELRTDREGNRFTMQELPNGMKVPTLVVKAGELEPTFKGKREFKAKRKEQKKQKVKHLKQIRAANMELAEINSTTEAIAA